MSIPSEWVPPRPTYHLRVFLISLALLALALVGMLFGVRLDAVVPVTGIITARELHEVRARFSGLVEPGWYDEGRFHRLQPGDVLKPGQPLAVVYDPSLESQLLRMENQIKEHSARGDSYEAMIRERDRLRQERLQTKLRAPESAECWLVLEVRVAPGQKVEAGEVLAVLVPADPTSHEPRGLVARLDVQEKHWAGVAVDQKVRLTSAVYNPRLFGHAEACIERLEPWGEPAPGGKRRFHALAPITHAPFALPVGSSFQAEIAVGRKPVYRIILEH